MNQQHILLSACAFLYYGDHSIHELEQKVEQMLSTLSERECFDTVAEVVKNWREPFVMDHRLWKLKVKKDMYSLKEVDELHHKQKEILHVTPFLLEYARDTTREKVKDQKPPMPMPNDGANLMFLHQCVAVSLRKEPQFMCVSHKLGSSVRKMYQKYCEKTGSNIRFSNFVYKVEPSVPFRFSDQTCFQMKMDLSQRHTIVSLIPVEDSEACVDIPVEVEGLLTSIDQPALQEKKLADISLGDIDLAKQLVAVILLNCKDYKATASSVGGKMRLLLDQWNQASENGRKLPSRILSFLPDEFYVTINETNHMIQKTSQKDELTYGLFITDNTDAAVSLDPNLLMYIPKHRLFKKEQAKGFMASATNAPQFGSRTKADGKNVKAELRSKLKETVEMLNSQLSQLPSEPSLKKQSKRDKKKNKTMGLSEEELEFLVPMVCVCLLHRPDRRAFSSFLGSDVRELNDQWCKSTGKSRAIPPRMFAGLPDVCQVRFNDDLYLMTKIPSNGEFEFSLEEAEELNESSSLYNVSSELLDVLDSDSSAGEEEERLQRILDSEPIRVESLPTETLGAKLLQFFNHSIASNLLPVNSRNDLAQKLQNLLSTEEYPVKILLFGSSVNNLGLKGSDVDITIVPIVPNAELMSKEEAARNYISLLHEHPYKNMKTLAKKLRKAKMSKVIPIGHARVPICKFVDPHHKVACDINFGHALGYHNSKLLYAYTKLDPRVKPLIVLIKFWAKRRDLNDPAEKHTISSYSWSIMAIAFLIQKGYIKSLQDPILKLEKKLIRVPEVNLKSKSSIDRVIDVTACYDLDDPALEPILNRKFDGKELWCGPDGVAAMLGQFFAFYAYEYKYKPSIAITIRDRVGVKSISPTDNRKLVVLDPFELDRNCTAMVQKTLPLIIEEFRSADRLFKKGNMEQLFEKTVLQVKSSKRIRKPR
jgi:DNA polymerase sigma